jgi:carboxypeptidase Taq
MAKTTITKADRTGARGRVSAAAGRRAQTAAKPTATGPARKESANGPSAKARLADLKHRLRQMADPSPPAKPGAKGRRAAASAVGGKGAKAPARPAAGKGARRPRKGADRSVGSRLAELKRRLQEISDLGFAASVLGWDQATYMPKGGAAARARQGATLSRLAHERLTDAEIGRLLDGLEAHAAREPADSDVASMIRVLRRDYEKAVKVPAEFVARWSEMGSASYDAWTRARPANDFGAMRPFLEQALDFSRRYAAYLGPYRHIADPLIDGPDPGMTVASVRALFGELRAELVPIVRAICEQQPADDSCLRGHFPEARQMELGFKVIERFGYDLERGRLDKTHHPFCTKFSSGDVRITTRVKEHDISEALFSTLHEAGHALYEQGVDPAFDATGLGSGVSAGVHESQSRLWENVVGRSRGFWEHFYPLLRDAFPEHYERVPLETFYRAINKVSRSLIRTDADEVTYNLHVMLRFDLELDLLEGHLEVKDLPEAWRARFEADFGIAPPDDRDGCLQDVHWYGGNIGGSFQGYTIGNILSAQFHAAAVAAHPEIPRETTEGKFGTLHAWLREHLYRHGRKLAPDAIVRRATGSPMTIAPYMAYLRGKYGELYDLPAAEARVQQALGCNKPEAHCTDWRREAGARHEGKRGP